MDVSLLVPIKDSRYSDDAIKSIIDSNWMGLEYEVILLAENPVIYELVKEKYSHYENFRVLATFEENLPAALNLGLRAAKGQFIARFDADDLNLSSRFQFQTNFLLEHPDYAAIGGQVLLINQSGIEIGKSKYPISWGFFKRIIIFTCCIAHPAAMYRRDLALRIGGYSQDLQTSEDWDFWLRLQQTGKIQSLPNVVIKYRIHPYQKSQNSSEKKFISEKKIIGNFWKDLSINTYLSHSSLIFRTLNRYLPERLNRWRIARKGSFALQILNLKSYKNIRSFFSKSLMVGLESQILLIKHPLLIFQVGIVYIINKFTLFIRRI